jgi:hypothetical protein
MARVSDGDEHERSEPPPRHRRRPGTRYISSVACLVAGVGLLIIFATAPAETWRLAGGVVLVVLGLVSIPVYAWMDRRRL